MNVTMAHGIVRFLKMRITKKKKFYDLYPFRIISNKSVI